MQIRLLKLNQADANPPLLIKNMIYLDNSATTKQYDQVTDLMVQCMEEDFGNPSSLYQLGVDSEKILKKARKQVMDALGHGGTKDFSKSGSLIFTSGGTEADNMAIFGTAKALRRAGNRIVTTAVEHPAVLECCKSLEQDGFEVVYVGVDGKGCLDMQQLANAINDKTILVSIMHVNNESGTIMPIDDVRAVMDEKRAPGLLHCDAVQSFCKLNMPQKADLIAISGHKINGPKGSGALWIANKAGNGRTINLPALICGGGQETGKRSGTENVPALAGLGLAAELSAWDQEDDMQRIGEMREQLKEGLLQAIPDIRINSPQEIGYEAGLCCPSILSVSFTGTRGEVLLHTLEQYSIYVSTGSACSSNKKGQSHVLMAMGLKDKEIEGTIRFSLGRFNTKEEIDEAIEKTAVAVERFRLLGSFR